MLVRRITILTCLHCARNFRSVLEQSDVCFRSARGESDVCVVALLGGGERFVSSLCSGGERKRGHAAACACHVRWGCLSRHLHSCDHRRHHRSHSWVGEGAAAPPVPVSAALAALTASVTSLRSISGSTVGGGVGDAASAVAGAEAVGEAQGVLLPLRPITGSERVEGVPRARSGRAGPARCCQ